MKQPPSLLEHARDILILPFTVTIIVPLLLYNPQQTIIPNHIALLVTGLVLMTAGLLLFIYTVFLFRSRGKGTLAPWAPTQKLVVTGPYRYCRNPMITGVFCILAGETMVFHSLNIAIWAVAFFLINTSFFIFYEEPSLLKRFGDDYTIYKKHVPRWIPRLTPYNPAAESL